MCITHFTTCLQAFVALYYLATCHGQTDLSIAQWVTPVPVQRECTFRRTTNPAGLSSLLAPCQPPPLCPKNTVMAHAVSCLVCCGCQALARNWIESPDRILLFSHPADHPCCRLAFILTPSFVLFVCCCCGCCQALARNSNESLPPTGRGFGRASTFGGGSVVGSVNAGRNGGETAACCLAWRHSPPPPLSCVGSGDGGGGSCLC